MRRSAKIFLLICTVLLAGCQQATHPPPDDPPSTIAPVAPDTAAEVTASGREAPQFQFSDDALGIAVLPTPGFTLRNDFKRDYLAAGEWKTFAGPQSRGAPVFALLLDGSDTVTAAELRVGASSDAADVAACLDVGGAVAGDADEVRIDGQPFRHVRTGDAAMSHYLMVDAYRAVRGGHCVAIDLLVTGTRPEVYDPPKTPPFDQDTARARLQDALGAIRFTR